MNGFPETGNRYMKQTNDLLLEVQDKIQAH